MKQYKIYENDFTKEVEAVKQGWSWPAFFFGWIWAFVKKNWLLGGILLGISIVLNVLMRVGNEPVDVISAIASIALGVFLGMKGNSLREANLIKRGFVEKETLSAGRPIGALSLYMVNKNK